MCKTRKPFIQGKVPLLPNTSSAPLEIVGTDFLHLEKSSGGFEYTLLITDHFTRYTQVYSICSKAAKTAATHLYNDFVLRFGIPSQLLHDQGEKFENALFKYLANLLGIQNLQTTPYNPETNGVTERINQTVLAMLRTLPEKYITSWKDHVNKVIHAYNCTKHSRTGFPPYYLMFRHKPRLPIDIILQTEVYPLHSTHRQYLENWKEVIEDAYKTALRNSTCRTEHDKERKLQAGQCLDKLEQGGKVLVRNLAPRGDPGKLRPYCEPEIAEVVHDRKMM